MTGFSEFSGAEDSTTCSVAHSVLPYSVIVYLRGKIQTNRAAALATERWIDGGKQEKGKNAPHLVSRKHKG